MSQKQNNNNSSDNNSSDNNSSDNNSSDNNSSDNNSSDNNSSNISLNEKPKMYGWFSQKQLDNRVRSNGLCSLRKDKRNRKYPKYNIYLTVDGREVQITMVSKSNNKADFNFDDIQFKGEVVKWVRAIF